MALLLEQPELPMHRECPDQQVIPAIRRGEIQRGKRGRVGQIGPAESAPAIFGQDRVVAEEFQRSERGNLGR